MISDREEALAYANQTAAISYTWKGTEAAAQNGTRYKPMNGRYLRLISMTSATAIFALLMFGCAPDYWPNGTTAEVQAELERCTSVSEMINTNAIN